MRRERRVPEHAKAFIIQEVIRNGAMIRERIERNAITRNLPDLMGLCERAIR